jgi:hypothetical protein
MDSFGIITRKDWTLSPAACVVCEALEEAVTARDTLDRQNPGQRAWRAAAQQRRRGERALPADTGLAARP